MPPLTSNSFQAFTQRSPVPNAPARSGGGGLRIHRPQLSGPTSAGLVSAMQRPAPLAPVPAQSQRVPNVARPASIHDTPRWAVGYGTAQTHGSAKPYNADEWEAQTARDTRYRYTSPGMQGIGFSLAPVATATQGGAAGNLLTGAISAVPIVGQILGPVTNIIRNLLGKSGAQKTKATALVNELEPQLAKNRDTYLSHPSPAMQQAALANFDEAWAWLAGPTGCGDPKLGAAGQRCLSERGRGGTAAWCPTGGGCDWFTLYRNPIADTPPTIADGPTNTAAPGTTGNPGGTGVVGSDIGQSIASTLFSFGQMTIAGFPAWMVVGAVGLALMALPGESNGPSPRRKGKR
jgi:hypothetical protein